MLRDRLAIDNSGHSMKSDAVGALSVGVWRQSMQDTKNLIPGLPLSVGQALRPRILE